MARQSTDKDRLKTLSRQLDTARSDLGQAAVAMRRRLDLPCRMRDSFRRHPAAWFGGSLAAGLVVSAGLVRLRRRPALIQTTAPAGHKSRIAGAAAIIFTLLRPVIQKWLLQQIRPER